MYLTIYAEDYIKLKLFKSDFLKDFLSLRQ